MDISALNDAVAALCDQLFPTDHDTFDDDIRSFLVEFDEFSIEARKSGANNTEIINALKAWLRGIQGGTDFYVLFNKAWQLYLSEKKSNAARDKLAIDREDFLATRILDQLAQTALDHFSKHKDYTIEEALGWFVFSAMLWDGVKDTEILYELLKRSIYPALDVWPLMNPWDFCERHNFVKNFYNKSTTFKINKKSDYSNFKAFIHHTTAISLDYISEKNIGYEIIRVSGKNEKDKVRTAHQIVLGNMTRLWLIKLNEIMNEFDHKPKIIHRDEFDLIFAPIVGVFSEVSTNRGRKSAAFDSKWLFSFLQTNGLLFLQRRAGIPPAIAMTFLSQSKRIQMVGLRLNSWENLLEFSAHEIITNRPISSIDEWFEKWHENNGQRMKVCNDKGIKKIREIITDKKNIPQRSAESKGDNATDIIALKKEWRENKNTKPDIYTLLVNWYISQDDVVYKTRLQYFGQLAHLTSFVKEADFANWERDDYISLYNCLASHAASRVISRHQASNNETIRTSSTLYNAIQRFHKFLDSYFPSKTLGIIDSVSLRSELKPDKAKIVSANVISPSAYKYLLASCQNALPFDSERIRVFFILAYRTGMRSSELLELTLNDFSGLEINRLIVTKYRKGKTASARRRVPLWGLLKPNELRFVTDELNKISPLDAHRLIFTRAGYQNVPYSSSELIEMLNHIMSEFLPYREEINLHTFRHAAISNILLAMGGHRDLVKALTDYTEKDIDRMKEALSGNYVSPQELFTSGAGQVGHLEAGSSFTHYYAYGWLTLTYALAQSSDSIPVKAVSNLTGIAYNSILKGGSKGLTAGTVCLNSLNVMLSKKIHPEVKNNPISIGATHPLGTEQNIDSLPMFTPTPRPKIFRNFSLRAYYEWLKFYEKNNKKEHEDAIKNLITQIHSDTHVATYYVTRLINQVKDLQSCAEDPKMRRNENLTRIRERIRHILDPPLKEGQHRKITLVSSSKQLLSKACPLKLEQQTEDLFEQWIMPNLMRVREDNPLQYAFFVRNLTTKLQGGQSFLGVASPMLQELPSLAELLAKILPDYCQIHLELTPLHQCKTYAKNKYHYDLKKKGKRKVRKQRVYSDADVQYLKNYPNIKIEKKLRDNINTQFAGSVEPKSPTHKLFLKVKNDKGEFKKRIDILFHLGIITYTLDVHLPHYELLQAAVEKYSNT